MVEPVIEMHSALKREKRTPAGEDDTIDINVENAKQAIADQVKAIFDSLSNAQKIKVNAFAVDSQEFRRLDFIRGHRTITKDQWEENEKQIPEVIQEQDIVAAFSRLIEVQKKPHHTQKELDAAKEAGLAELHAYRTSSKYAMHKLDEWRQPKVTEPEKDVLFKAEQAILRHDNVRGYLQLKAKASGGNPDRVRAGDAADDLIAQVINEGAYEEFHKEMAKGPKVRITVKENGKVMQVEENTQEQEDAAAKRKPALEKAVAKLEIAMQKKLDGLAKEIRQHADTKSDPAEKAGLLSDLAKLEARRSAGKPQSKNDSPAAFHDTGVSAVAGGFTLPFTNTDGPGSDRLTAYNVAAKSVKGKRIA